MEEARAFAAAGDDRPRILERERELERVEALIQRARSGHGCLAYVEGPAGLGKAALLADARAKAEAAGMAVAEARGSDLERPFAFGVVRQLLGHAVWRGDRRTLLLSGAAALATPLFDPGAVTAEHQPASASSPWPMLHGLYWLVANFCEERPLALLIDDAHLADTSSLGFLAFLAGRLTELPLFVAVAVRPAEGETAGPLLDELSSASGVEIIRPRPLSPEAVEKLIQEQLGYPPERQFRDACHQATRGNPFYVGELLRDVADRGLRPTAEDAARVRELGPPPTPSCGPPSRPTSGRTSEPPCMRERLCCSTTAGPPPNRSPSISRSPIRPRTLPPSRHSGPPLAPRFGLEPQQRPLDICGARSPNHQRRTLHQTCCSSWGWRRPRSAPNQASATSRGAWPPLTTLACVRRGHLRSLSSRSWRITVLGPWRRSAMLSAHWGAMTPNSRSLSRSPATGRAART